jgi:hypothetical protein
MWQSTHRCCATSVYFVTSPLARPGCPSSSHPKDQSVRRQTPVRRRWPSPDILHYHTTRPLAKQGGNTIFGCPPDWHAMRLSPRVKSRRINKAQTYRIQNSPPSGFVALSDFSANFEFCTSEPVPRFARFRFVRRLKSQSADQSPQLVY